MVENFTNMIIGSIRRLYIHVFTNNVKLGCKYVKILEDIYITAFLNGLLNSLYSALEPVHRTVLGHERYKF